MIQRKLRRGMRPGRRPSTCYHEAGHCVARWWIGHHFHQVQVLTTQEAEHGVQPLTWNGQSLEGADGFMDAPSLVLPVFTPAPLAQTGGDPTLVADLHRSTAVAVEMDLFETYVGVEAEVRYTKKSVWAALAAGGARDMAHIRHLLDTWYPDVDARCAADVLATDRAKAVTRSKDGWRAITTLATALLERGQLEWSEAEPIISAAYGRPQPHRNAWELAWL